MQHRLNSFPLPHGQGSFPAGRLPASSNCCVKVKLLTAWSSHPGLDLGCCQPAVIHGYERIFECRCHGLCIAQRTGSHARALGSAQGSSPFYIARQRGHNRSILLCVLGDPLRLTESGQEAELPICPPTQSPSSVTRGTPIHSAS